MIRGTNINSNPEVNTSFSKSITQFIDSNPSDTKWNKKIYDSSEGDFSERVYLPRESFDSGEGETWRERGRERSEKFPDNVNINKGLFDYPDSGWVGTNKT